MDRWAGRVALVTGASAGIGAGICRELVKHGMLVVGCARSAHRIEAIAKEEEVKKASGRLHAIKCDLTKESDILRMFGEIRSKFGRLDVCVNNAGFSYQGSLLSGKTSDWREMLEVNVLALCICTRESVKIMMENHIDDGQIIQISSVGGHRLPSLEMTEFNFYCGTKFMVQALTKGLRRELRNQKSHIRSVSIGPGLVKTEFFSRAFGGAKPSLGDDMHKVTPLVPADIAQAVVYVLSTPPHVDVNDMIIRPLEEPL